MSQNQRAPEPEIHSDGEEEGGRGFPAVAIFRYRPKKGCKSPAPDASGMVAEHTTFQFDMTTTAEDVVSELHEKLIEEGHTPEAHLVLMGLYLHPSANNDLARSELGGKGDLLVELDPEAVLAENELVQEEVATEEVVRFMVAKTSTGVASPLKVQGKRVIPRPKAPKSNTTSPSRQTSQYSDGDGGGKDYWSPSAALRVEQEGSPLMRGNSTDGLSFSQSSRFVAAMSPSNHAAALKSEAALEALEGKFPESGGRIVLEQDLTVADIDAARALVDKRVRQIKDARKVIPERRHWTRELAHAPTEKELIKLRRAEEAELGSYLSWLDEESPKAVIKLELVGQEAAKQEEMVQSLTATLQSKTHVETKRNSLHQEVSSLKAKLLESTEREKLLRGRVSDQQARLKQQVRAMSNSPYRATSTSPLRGAGTGTFSEPPRSELEPVGSYDVAAATDSFQKTTTSSSSALGLGGATQQPSFTSPSLPLAGDANRGDITATTAQGGSPVISRSLSDALQQQQPKREVQPSHYDPREVAAPANLAPVDYSEVLRDSAPPLGSGGVPTSAWKSRERPTLEGGGFQQPQAYQVQAEQPHAQQSQQYHQPQLQAPPAQAPPSSMDISELLSPELRRDVLKMLGSGSGPNPIPGGSPPGSASRRYHQPQQSVQLAPLQPPQQQQQPYASNPMFESSPLLQRGTSVDSIGSQSGSNNPQMKVLANDLSAFLDSDGGDLATRRLLLSKVQAARRSMEQPQ